MKIVYLGYAFRKLVRRYEEGNYPSHLLYGYPELAAKGENLDSKQIPRSIKGAFPFMTQLIKDKPDIIIIPYIYEGPLIPLIFLKKARLVHTSIIAISHKSFKKEHSLFRRYLYKWLYQSFDRILFHSPLSMQESLELKWVSPTKLSTIHWGVDMKYYDRTISPKESTGFVSTGRENRDFPTLINAFSRQGSQLTIYTNSVNYENDYTFLSQYIGLYPNIHIHLVENTQQTAQTALNLVANSFCVVIPVYCSSLSYCVGHTSIVEALALGKPIIATRNPYHPIDIEKEGVGIYVEPEDEQSWIAACNYLLQNQDEARQMGEKARKLAERIYNADNFSEELYAICCNLAK